MININDTTVAVETLAELKSVLEGNNNKCKWGCWGRNNTNRWKNWLLIKFATINFSKKGKKR